MIEKWAKIIQEQEGWHKGSLTYKLNNPGALKWHNQNGNIGKDKSGFAIFPDYETGFRALCRQLEMACSGRSKVYRPENTLYDFFNKYAPSQDHNSPNLYAEVVAFKLGVKPTIKIKNLL